MTPVASLPAAGRDLYVLRDLAAFALDNAVMAYPRSTALEECVESLKLLLAMIREDIEDAERAALKAVAP